MSAMKKHKQSRNEEDDNNNDDDIIAFKPNADICQQLMDRYAKSSAPHHRHLIATAAAMRSILASESLPLIPPAYFAAAISSASTADTHDPTAVSALLTFLSMVIPMVPPQGIAAEKASEAVAVVVRVVEREGEEKLGVASSRCGVKSLGSLLVGFCDLDDWNAIILGFESLLKFSLDKRPKVRRCAQECLEKVFSSFKSSSVIKEASKLIYSLLQNHMAAAVNLSTTRIDEGSKHDLTSKPESIEALHLLNVLGVTIPFLSVEIGSKVLLELHKLMACEFSALTRQIFKALEVFFRASKNDNIFPEIENIITSLTGYLSLRDKNPADTLMRAATLLKHALDKLHSVEPRSCLRKLPLVCGSLAGLLTSMDGDASQASVILKVLMNYHLDKKALLIDGNQSFEDEIKESEETNAVKSVCAIFESSLNSCDAIPNEHILAVISLLFHKLGELSCLFMRGIVLKLADLITAASEDASKISHLQSCIGSAVIAMGPDQILNLLPISFDVDGSTCSNTWLVPVLKKYTIRASLGYYMDHIVPLAKSFRRASSKVKKSAFGKELQAHAHSLLELLPAFCRYPTDMHQKFGSLAELLVKFLNKYYFMRENIALSLQVLVNQNKGVLRSQNDVGEGETYAVEDCVSELETVTRYTKKVATKNIRPLASYSAELLQALVKIFVDSLPGTCLYLKDAIGCLASVTDSSFTKKIFVSSLVKFKFMNGEGEIEVQGSQPNESDDKEKETSSTSETQLKRCVVMDLASSLVEGAKEDLVELIYSFIRQNFQATEEIVHREAYHTLSRVLEEHSWFGSSHFVELLDMLLGLKSPVDVGSIQSRFSCFRVLLLHAFQISSEEDNEKAFLILNEIILTLKDGNEESRKAAYDALIMMNTSLNSPTCVTSGGPCRKLTTMIMGYLSGSSPHIKSGAVSALSVLVYKDPEICLSTPELMSSLLSLLQTKDIEVIKAVLGFVKVVVSSLQSNDLQKLLPDLITAILPWSPVSRHHFRSKVTVILEILIRKCGSRAVQSLTPEKYKGFLKIVLENRSVKSSLKEETTDPVTEPTDSTKGPRKRKHEVSDKTTKDNGQMDERKRKREKRRDFDAPGSNKPFASPNVGGGGGGGKGRKTSKNPKHFNRGNSTKGRPGKGEKEGKKGFGKGPANDGKRKMGKLRSRKGGEAASASDSKTHKRMKAGKK